ncbi:hypothetical protein OP10G_3645 [Fimbriimonas ginsengisoli Gsoil 348]|uniref:Uncharacterized protein n=1 Tax=Fimbriimonas ginsengisoli Gsoil 348 TaxID=661478 RepID=A0A068NU05_FIMGI|nr:hypothetical protein OP10G_3645 [Fimbriimonas ginsengisoli Gsoil 348]
MRTRRSGFCRRPGTSTEVDLACELKLALQIAFPGETAGSNEQRGL